MKLEKKGPYYFLFFALLLLLITGGTTPLAALEPLKPVNQYLLDEWDMRNGFPSDNILAIAQTPDGYLWFGATNGLVRYDGVRFVRFDIVDPPPLDRWIRDMLVDREGTLWIARRQGLTRYKDGEFITYSTAEGLTGGLALSITEDCYGSLWVGTGRYYLHRFRNGTFTPINPADGMNARFVTDSLEDRNGILWIAGANDGLFYGRRGKFKKYTLDGRPEHTAFTFTLYLDRKGVLWLGNQSGLLGITHPLSPQERQVTFSPLEGGPMAGNMATAILEDSDDNLWVGTFKGMKRIHRGNDDAFTIHPLLGNTPVTSLFEDREKSLWIGTQAFGLKRLRDVSVKTWTKEKGVPVGGISLYNDRAGDHWLVYGGLLLRYGDGMFRPARVTENMEGIVITALEEDPDGNLWLGTIADGICRVGEGKAVHAFELKGNKQNRTVYALKWDSRDRLWAATCGDGVWVVQNGSLRAYTTGDGLPTNDIYNVFEDSQTNIWIGTGDGLVLVKNGHFHRDQMETYLKGRAVSAIHEDAEGVLWIGSHNSGLVRFKDHTPVYFTTNTGLAGNSIIQIVEDSRETFLMSTPHGILSVAKKELNDFADGKIQHVNSMSFGLADGMQSLSCTFSPNHSIIRAGADEFWFATEKGVSVIQPGKVRINRYPPPVVIEGIRFNGNPVRREFAGRRFKNIHNLRFDFTAPTFISPEKVKLFYRLEGYDSQWRTVSAFTERRAFYNDLPPGNYTFRVTAANSNGVRNPTGASFPFTLVLPFYRTLFFKITILLPVLMLLVAGFLVTRRTLYMRRLKNKYKNSTLDPEKAELLLKKLRFLLEVKKVFLDETLSLKALAAKLGIPPRYLSQVMNERLNKNFWDVVNGYRVEEAKKMLLKPAKKDTTILEIAFEVGFNSKEVFNRAFKKYTGMTPSQFKRPRGDS